MNTESNRRWVLARRPHGEPDDETLRLETVPRPEPGPGQVLLRTEYLSLDPYMRGRMDGAASYADPVELGDVMVGGTVARVVESRHDGYRKGDLVLSHSGWQDYALADGREPGGLTRLNDTEHPSWALGILGMPGFTAWAGLTQIGQPEAGETVVVAAAAGPVGATVGQIARILGCRAVGVAGGPEKCAHVVDNLGFDACIDHRADDFAARLAAACPDGIDIYYENVGGKVFDAVMPLLNTKARIPLCGLVAGYNATARPAGPDRLGDLMRLALIRQLTIRGFIIFDNFGDLYPGFAREMNAWIEQGQIAYREDIVDGLENAPAAFRGMLRGENFGKCVIRVAT